MSCLVSTHDDDYDDVTLSLTMAMFADVHTADVCVSTFYWLVSYRKVRHQAEMSEQVSLVFKK